MLKNIFLVNRWRKKLSICGNCYFILTLLGVCHVKVNFVCPLKLKNKDQYKCFNKNENISLNNTKILIYKS